MAPHSEKRDPLDSAPGDDDLGSLIRWSLQDSFSHAEPSADAWPKILQRVQAMDTPVLHPPAKRARQFAFASLVQAGVACALLLVFGLSIEREVSTPQTVSRTPMAPSPEQAGWSRGFPEDALSGYVLAHGEPEAPARTRPGGMHP